MEAIGNGSAIEERRAADGPALGLTDAAVAASCAAHGRNVLAADARSGLLATLREVVADPMFVLLLVTGAIYFWMGHLEDALALDVALLLVAGISVYQSVRNDRTLGALHELTQPRAQVRRNGRQWEVTRRDKNHAHGQLSSRQPLGLPPKFTRQAADSSGLRSP